jgi:arylsulfatase A-like enzyme
MPKGGRFTMARRGHKWTAVAFSAVLAAADIAAQESPGSVYQARDEPSSARPNIILVLADDLDLELDTVQSMEVLRTRVAGEGMTFDGFLVPLSLCCPSRTTILKGQYSHNHGILTNNPPGGGFEKAYDLGVEESTIATALQAAGYRTVLFGKYLNGYPVEGSEKYVPPGWTEWYSPASGRAYGAYDYVMNENGALVSYGSDPGDYITDVIGVKAADFILRNSQAGGPPFFLYFSTYAPHSPYTPAPRHASLFPGAQAPRPPSFNEEDVSDKPAYVQAKPLLTPDQIAELDRIHRLRMQSLQAIDEALADVLAALEAVGRLDDTYVFFTSDNGYHLGEHRLDAGKYTPYETDVRVPLFVRGPGVPGGVVTAALSGTVDLAPTFAELAGVTLPVEHDGRSLAPVLLGDGRSEEWRGSFLLEDFRNGEAATPTGGPDYASIGPDERQGVLEPPDPADYAPEAIPSHAGFRAGSYKYVQYQTGEIELYLLEKDPFELENRAGAAAAAVLDALSAHLAPLRDCAGEDCRGAEGAAPPALLTVDFRMFPAEPTDLTPVTFTASASGSPPYDYLWDIGGETASGATVTLSMGPGTHEVRLTVTDAIGAEASVTKTLTVRASVTVSSVAKVADPYRLKVRGDRFAPGCRVLIGGQPVPETSYNSATEVVAKKGAALKAMTPQGVTVEVVVENPDGGRSMPFSFVR